MKMKYLQSTYFLDYESDEIQNLVAEFNQKGLSKKEKITKVYLKVRDGWRYNPYKISFSKEHYCASYLATKKEGHCIDKAILLTTCLRALGVPARIHLAKVKNHIAVEKLVEKFGTNELTPHGMVDVFYDGKWVKCSPAFNAGLCKKCNVAPLDFNAEEDSIFQEFNGDGKEFMEYIEDYGHFEDLPLAFIAKNMKEHYGHFVKRKEGVNEI